MNENTTEEKVNTNIHMFVSGILEKLCLPFSINCFLYKINSDAKKLELFQINPKGEFKVSLLLTKIGLYVLYDKLHAMKKYPYLFEAIPTDNFQVFLPKWVKLASENSYSLSKEFHCVFRKQIKKKERKNKLILLGLLLEVLTHTKDFLNNRNSTKIPFNTFLKRIFTVLEICSLKKEQIKIHLSYYSCTMN